MYVLKFALTDTNEDLSVELKKQLSNDCDINIVKSVGLLGSTEIIVAIVAAAPGIITTIASVIKNYLERNSNKSLTIEICCASSQKPLQYQAFPPAKPSNRMYFPLFFPLRAETRESSFTPR